MARNRTSSANREAAGDNRTEMLLRYGMLLAALVFGGSSRNDAVNQPLLQLISVGVIAAAAVMQPGIMARSPRLAWVPVAALAALMAVQLIPLPPFVWQALPGRALVADIDAAAGIAMWRPISLYPDGTLSALLGMIVPAAALFAFARPHEEEHLRLTALLLAIILAGAVIGALQMASGSGPLYFYRLTNEGLPVGFFANRNHHAVLLSLVPPLVATVALHLREQRSDMTGMAVGAAVMIAGAGIVTLLTASRLGIGLYLMSLFGAALLFLMMKPRGSRVKDRFSRLHIGWIGGGIAAALVAGIVVLFSTDSVVFAGLARIADTDLMQEGRWTLLPYVIDTAQSYFPFGGGFGSFDRLYRIHEPFDTLTLAYLNHAHNDLAEIAVEGGLAALALFAGTLIAYFAATFALWRSGRAKFSRSLAMGRLGSIFVPLLMLGGITDYPLRTPALAFILVLALLWIGWATLAARNDSGSGDPAGRASA